MYIRWGTNKAVISGRITLSPGIDPDVWSLELMPGDVPELDADLTFGEGSGIKGRAVTLKDCRVQSGLRQYERDSRRTSITVRDWRWRWRFAEPISGEYNLRDDEGVIIGEKKSAQELGKLLYANLHTPTDKQPKDTTELPDDLYPYVNWNYSPPATELHKLCARYGLMICPAVGLELDNVTVFNRIQLYPRGQGVTIPGYPRKGWDDPIDPVDKPKNVYFVGGRNWVQEEVALEAVGYDPVAKDYKLLSATGADALPYRPSVGFYPGFEKDIADEEQQKAARDTVWRAYRIKADVQDGDGAWGVKLLGKFYTLSELKRRIKANLVQTLKWDDDERRWESAYVRGSHFLFAGMVDPELFATEDTNLVPAKFELDTTLGLVTFDEPVFGGLAEHDATLYLVAVFEVDAYMTEIEQADGIEDLYEVVRAESVRQLYIEAALQNKEEAQTAAEDYVAAAMRKYERPDTVQTNRYSGILPLSPDGAIWQISWSLTAAGPITEISWGAEHDIEAMPQIVRDKERDLRDIVMERRLAIWETGLAGDRDVEAL